MRRKEETLFLPFSDIGQAKQSIFFETMVTATVFLLLNGRKRSKNQVEGTEKWVMQGSYSHIAFQHQFQSFWSWVEHKIGIFNGIPFILSSFKSCYLILDVMLMRREFLGFIQFENQREHTFYETSMSSKSHSSTAQSKTKRILNEY